MKREDFAEEAYLAMIDAQSKIIEGLTEELKGANRELGITLHMREDMRDAANKRGEVILELRGIIAGYKNTRRVEWLKLFLIVFVASFAAHFIWALLAML